LTFRHRLGGWALGVASTLCVLSAWTKQTMLPFAAGLILYLWLADGRKMALRFLICFLVAGMAISAALIAVFGARSMYFNMVTLNVRRPWTGPRDSAPSVFHAFFYSIQELTAQSLLPAVILFTLCFATENLREHNLQSLLAKWKGELWFMLMVCAVVLVPSSIMGRTKLGGDSNALSPTLYFFAVAAAVQLLRVAVAPPHPELVAVRRGAILTLGFMAVLAVVTHWPFPADLWRQWERLPGNPQEIAFQEARERPGQIWFPNMPLPSLMAEKKLYHFSHGLEDRERTGFRVSQGHFDAGLPLHVKYAVFESDWMQGTMQKLGYLDEFPKRGTEPQAWTVYIKE